MSGIEDVSEALIRRKLRQAIRELEVFRPGVVSHVEPPAEPGGLYMATVNGRPMPYIDPTLEVGDIVKYVDQPDPFAWARLDGFEEPIPGDGLWDLDLFQINWNASFLPFFPLTSRTIDASFPNDATSGLNSTLGIFAASAPDMWSTSSIGTHTEVYDDLAIGSGFGGLWYRVVAHDASPRNETFTISWGASVESVCSANYIALQGVQSVVEVSDTEINTGFFPTVTAPGEDWSVFYIAVIENLAGVGGVGPNVSRPIPGSSLSVDAAITRLDPSLAPRPNVAARGDLVWGYEVTDAAGETTPRSFALNGASASYALTTFLVDTSEP